jgi:hypothetical protein
MMQDIKARKCVILRIYLCKLFREMDMNVCFLTAFTVKHLCKDRYHKLYPELLDWKLFARHKPTDATCEECILAKLLKSRNVKLPKTGIARE